MESLALLVAGLLLGMLVSGIAAVLMAWRSVKLGVRVAATVLALPAAYIGAMLVLNAGSLGGRVIGSIGLLCFGFVALRLQQSLRA